MVPHSVKTLARGVPARMMALPQSASSGPISHYTYDVLIRRVLQGLPNSQTLKQRQIIPDPNDKANGQDDPRPCRHAIRSIPIARQPLPCVRRGIEDSAFQILECGPISSPFWAFDSELVRHCMTVLSQQCVLYKGRRNHEISKEMR